MNIDYQGMVAQCKRNDEYMRAAYNGRFMYLFHAPVTDNVINSCERTLGITFPPSFVEFVRFANGAEFTTEVVRGHGASSVFTEIYRLDEILRSTFYYRKNFHDYDRFIVVGTHVEGEDLLLLDLRTESASEFALVNSVDFPQKGIIPFAASFGDFYMSFLNNLPMEAKTLFGDPINLKF
jgi:hypothetical protein